MALNWSIADLCSDDACRAKMKPLYNLDSSLFNSARVREMIEVLYKPSYDGPKDYTRLGVLISPVFESYALAVNTHSPDRLMLQNSIEEYFKVVCEKEGVPNYMSLARKCMDLVCSTIKLPMCTQRSTVVSAKVTLTTTNKMPAPTPIVSSIDLDNYGFAQLQDAVKSCEVHEFTPVANMSQHSVSGTFIPSLFKAQVKLFRDVTNKAKEANIRITPWWTVI